LDSPAFQAKPLIFLATRNEITQNFTLTLFDGFPIYFQFWEGDDEYKPRIFFLWDTNTAQYIHLETTFYLLNMVLHRMTELFEEE
jgi:hypothetical protein